MGALRKRLAAGLAFLVLAHPAAAGERPNVLWLSAEDMGPILGCYGDEQADTPALDALAARGVRFERAFAPAGVCAPTRSSIISGLYAPSLGTHPMRSRAALPDFVRLFPAYLRDAGYWCTNNAKTDYQLASIPGDAWDASGGRAHWKDRPDPGQPFFAVFNYTASHESRIWDGRFEQATQRLPEGRRHSGEGLAPPPYYPDTPEVREDWRRAYDLTTALDLWVGERLAELADAGLADDTIVFFWTDHGVGLPRAKRWVYDSGTRVPLLVHVPERFRRGEASAPGMVRDDPVSLVDLGPTVLALCGLEAPGWMQGRPFLTAGGGMPLTPREFAFSARDRMDERYDCIRSARSARYRYVRNFEPWRPYLQHMEYCERQATARSIRALLGELTGPAAMWQAARKPVEELYDLELDPHETVNLADSPAHARELARHRDALERWMASIRDLGLVAEAELVAWEEAHGDRWSLLRGEDGTALYGRLRAAAEVVGADTVPTTDAVRALCADPSASVRVWGARAAARIDARELWIDGLTDTSASVRIECARALVASGEGDAISALVESLGAEGNGARMWERLAAALALDELEELARPALAALEAAREDGNEYVRRVAERAVAELAVHGAPALPAAEAVPPGG